MAEPGELQACVEILLYIFRDILSAAKVDTSDHSLIAEEAAPMEGVLLRWMFSKFGRALGKK